MFALYFIRIYSKAHTSIQAYTLPTEQSLTEYYTQGKNSGCLQYFHDEWLYAHVKELKYVLLVPL